MRSRQKESGLGESGLGESGLSENSWEGRLMSFQSDDLSRVIKRYD